MLKVITYGITQPAHLPYYKAADPIMPESGDKDSASENKNKIFRAVFEQDREKKAYPPLANRLFFFLFVSVADTTEILFSAPWPMIPPTYTL